jgi:hypothetical protein
VDVALPLRALFERELTLRVRETMVSTVAERPEKQGCRWCCPTGKTCFCAAFLQIDNLLTTAVIWPFFSDFSVYNAVVGMLGDWYTCEMHNRGVVFR